MPEQVSITCLLCGREWPGDFRVCPRDGMFLACDGPSPEEFEPGATLGEYKIIRKLGSGGMATVYAACHGLIGKNVAIKILSRALMTNREAVGRFLQEARSVSLIGHKNIVEVFGYGTLPDGRCYLVMELLDGQTLGEALALQGPLLIATLDILDQICDALEAAHAKGVIHRDLKPDNIFLLDGEDGRRRVKLLDFGLAKLAPLEEGANLTRTGVAMGTPEYLSPEQARGLAVDDRTDVYSLGVMLFEMLFGRLPFSADNAADMLAKHLLEEPPSPRELWPEIPERLESLLTRMLSKVPADRPTTIEVRKDIRALLVELDAADVLPPLISRKITAPPIVPEAPPAPEPVAADEVAFKPTEIMPVSDETAVVRRVTQTIMRRRWVPALALGVAAAAIALVVGGGHRPANEARASEAEPVVTAEVASAPAASPDEVRPAPAVEEPSVDEPAAPLAPPPATAPAKPMKKPGKPAAKTPAASDEWRLLDPWGR